MGGRRIGGLRAVQAVEAVKATTTAMAVIKRPLDRP